MKAVSIVERILFSIKLGSFRHNVIAFAHEQKERSQGGTSTHLSGQTILSVIARQLPVLLDQCILF